MMEASWAGKHARPGQLGAQPVHRGWVRAVQGIILMDGLGDEIAAERPRELSVPRSRSTASCVGPPFRPGLSNDPGVRYRVVRPIVQ
jgi:hypothetical protein